MLEQQPQFNVTEPPTEVLIDDYTSVSPQKNRTTEEADILGIVEHQKDKAWKNNKENTETQIIQDINNPDSSERRLGRVSREDAKKLLDRELSKKYVSRDNARKLLATKISEEEANSFAEYISQRPGSPDEVTLSTYDAPFKALRELSLSSSAKLDTDKADAITQVIELDPKDLNKNPILITKPKKQSKFKELWNKESAVKFNTKGKVGHAVVDTSKREYALNQRAAAFIATREFIPDTKIGKVALGIGAVAVGYGMYKLLGSFNEHHLSDTASSPPTGNVSITPPDALERVSSMAKISNSHETWNTIVKKSGEGASHIINRMLESNGVHLSKEQLHRLTDSNLVNFRDNISGLAKMDVYGGFGFPQPGIKVNLPHDFIEDVLKQAKELQSK